MGADESVQRRLLHGLIWIVDGAVHKPSDRLLRLRRVQHPVHEDVAEFVGSESTSVGIRIIAGELPHLGTISPRSGRLPKSVRPARD